MSHLNGMNFAMIGAAGFVAPRHMKAIKEIGGKLVAALDPHDSVGVLDSYFPDCAFFTEFERFDRFCSKFIYEDQGIDWVVVCSPNYLHDAHCRFGLRIGASVICEKPLTLTERNLDELQKVEDASEGRIYTILQLRLIELISKDVITNSTKGSVLYITPRGRWYDHSWKSDEGKSGGLTTNIGIHLFDYLIYVFGEPYNFTLLNSGTHRTISGRISFKKIEIDFILSLESDRVRRSFTFNNVVYDFPDISTLHTESYKRIINGKGFGIEDARASIKFCERLRQRIKWLKY